MTMYRNTLLVATSNKGLVDINADVEAFVAKSGVQDGMVNVYLHHTSASLLINEGADPQVLRDLENWIARLVVDGDPLFGHTQEGDDDMSAHVRAALTAVSVTLPVIDGKVALGQWQRIFLWEHRIKPMERRLTLSVWS